MTKFPAQSNQRPDAEHVRDLVAVALNAMYDAMDESFTSAELLSAVLTVMAHVVHVLLDKGVDETLLREAVDRVFPAPDKVTGPRPFDPRMN